MHILGSVDKAWRTDFVAEMVYILIYKQKNVCTTSEILAKEMSNIFCVLLQNNYFEEDEKGARKEILYSHHKYKTGLEIKKNVLISIGHRFLILLKNDVINPYSKTELK